MNKSLTTDESIDSAIMAAVGSHRFKVARVVGEVATSIGVEPEHIANRIAALVAENKLESFGNIENWRHSEIKVREQY